MRRPSLRVLIQVATQTTALIGLLCAGCGGSDDSSGEKSSASGTPGGWPGLSDKVRCGGLDTGIPASLEIDFDGKTYDLDAHVVSATSNSIGIRVVCSNPDDLSETFGATLSADTEDDFVVGTTYTERTPALKESDADEGRLELGGFDAQVQVAESSSTEIPSDEENEARLHLWYGDYSTDRGLPPDEEAQAEYNFISKASLTITSADELPEDEHQDGIAFIRYELHGELEVFDVPAVRSLARAAEPGRDPVTVRATF